MSPKRALIEIEPVLESVVAPDPVITQRAAAMLDRGDGLWEVAIVDLKSDGTYTRHWTNFPQMVHFALGEVERQQQSLILKRTTRFGPDGVQIEKPAD